LPNDWHFEVVFDYGDHEIAVPKPAPNLIWPARPDPFSRYRAGFELRSYRRCRRILMFHHFGAEQDVGNDCLVRSLDLEFLDQRGPVDPRDPNYTLLCAITQKGYRRDGAGYLTRSLPPLEFEYSRAQIQSDVVTLDRDSLDNLPEGIDGRRFQWLDLEGNGLNGTLGALPGGAWAYKENLSPLNEIVRPDGTHATQARLAPFELVDTLPSRSDFAGQQFLDLGGDGALDVTSFAEPVPGFFTRDDDEGWKPFRAFRTLPHIDWNAPNLKFVDLTGDGLADVLLTQDDAFVYAPSLGEEGFGRLETRVLGWDEERGPKLVSGDETQAVFLADMSGDGLNDLVRVRNREICYWPNLGYGRFGAKVTMDGAPCFADDERFDPARVQLADIDGAGMADILYVGEDGVWVCFNRSGNSWTEPRRIAIFPSADKLGAVQVFDLLGNGTACLVWSSPLPGIAGEVLRYVDLIGGQKPHLLTRLRNNLGAETRLDYVPSTRFYLADRYAGRSWITRVPFPVHVVERIETYDYIGRSRFTTRYAYHHGYFDGHEREFRGFGMVEQWDTEEHRDDTAFAPAAANWATQSWAPPTHTKTWFHTGAFVRAPSVSQQYAGEYWVEPALRGPAQAANRAAMELADTVLPAGLSAAEMREAFRALKGMVLRVEVYGEDGSTRAQHPYSVVETNFTIEQLQPIQPNRHGVFFVHARESLSFHYERRTDDPRVTHDVVLEVNAFGDVRRSVSIAYPRRVPVAVTGVPAAFAGMLAYDQQRLHVGATEHRYTNAISEPALHPDAHRAPLQSETIIAELTGIVPAQSGVGITNLFGFGMLDGHWATLWTGAHDIAYEEIPASDVNGAGTPSSVAARRIVERVRAFYRSDDLSALLNLDVLQSLALPGESYRLAFTPQMVTRIFGTRVSDPMLLAAGYTQFAPGGDWWIPSGRIFYSPGDADTAATEQQEARTHFYAPRRAVDPFGAISRLSYDGYGLLALTSTDALGNSMIASNDYRVLSPREITDANGNRTAFAFDALGLLAGTAVMGKKSETLGDSLTGFVTDLDDATTQQHLAQPFTRPEAVLANATSRLIYDISAYWRTRNDPAPAPPAIYTLAREIHVSDLAPNTATPYRHSFLYCDGFGREIQKKLQAEPGPLVPRGGDVAPRWVGSGWAIFDNKGNPVRNYEPFFSATHGFEFARTSGVSSVLLYDPAGRVVATLHPDHSWEKTVFDAWRQETWDASDTVLIADPRNDPDVADFFRRLPTADYLPGWYDQRHGGGRGPQAKAAADKTALHANTPAVVHFDSRGRVCLAVADNGGQFYATRVAVDAEDKPLAVIEASGRRTEEYCLREPISSGGFRYVAGYDVAGNTLYRNNMDAGARWSLANVAGHPVRLWDSRANAFRNSYDLLRRPTQVYASTGGSAETLTDRMVYGESQPNPEANNLRGKAFQIFDQAGVITTGEYDFKGNLLQGQRQLAAVYKTALDWSAVVPLETAVYTTNTRYDALNRPVELTSPDNSVIRPGYNEAGLLQAVDIKLRGSAASTRFVANIDYDAKGQRILIAYGNEATTEYAYDPETFRLTRLTTTRLASPPDESVVQDLSYTYDAVGNITSIRDDAQQTTFFQNRRVEPSTEYSYDAVHRLIEALGREHLGQTGGVRNAPAASDAFDAFRSRLAQPGDGNAMGTYVESYLYDAVGNVLEVQHQGSDPAHPGWTRAYSYDQPSPIEPSKFNNRLGSTSVGSGAAQPYTYDAHGNMTAMPHLPLMQWDVHDHLQATAQQVAGGGGTPETTWYVYDFAGQRVRKVTERQAVIGQMPTRKAERIYLGNFEIYRTFASDGATIELEREILHVKDETQCMALVETRTLGTDASPAQFIRYQLGNHLGSASLELDDRAQIISYEEYFPYGSTSYQAVRSQSETPKRYRYTGKERDEESGLYYHGARYYSPGLGRWAACDVHADKYPGISSYVFCLDNPILYHDIDGKDPKHIDGKLPKTKRDKDPKPLALAFYGGAASVGDNAAFEIGIKNTQKSYGKKYEKIAEFAASASSVVSTINAQKANSIARLDIATHSSATALYMVRDEKTGKSGQKTPIPKKDREGNSLYASATARAFESWGNGPDQKTVTDISFEKFTNDAVIELHGCKVATDTYEIVLDNLAKNLSEELHKAGKTSAVVIGHLTKANPSIKGNQTKDAEQDYRHGERAVFHNGKILFTTKESGDIGRDVIDKYLDMEAKQGSEYYKSKHVYEKAKEGKKK
jgi:RHS repeat-associated protein